MINVRLLSLTLAALLVLMSFSALAVEPKLSTSKALKSTPAASTKLTATQAYDQVIGWALGYGGAPSKVQLSNCAAIYDQVERAAYRYNVIPEFALAVVAAEASYGGGISHARKSAHERYQGEASQRHPAVFDDLAYSLSELAYIMDHCPTVEAVLKEYWSGPDGKYNHESRDAFVEATCKLYNGLRPYAEARQKNEDRSKFNSNYSDPKPSKEPAWAGLATGNLKGYKSAVGSSPLLASQLKYFEGHEEAYAAKIRTINKKLSVNESRVIARAILSYCDNTGWKVDPRLIMALVAAESAFKPKARSRVGALGLGQLMPGTAASFKIKDAYDPIQNLYGCVKYVEREQYRWKDSGSQDKIIDLVLASYNAGPGAVQKYKGVPPYKETKNYIKTVRKYYRQFTQGS
jgi:soluble lytic murein transglycosylase-like protein